MTAEPLFARVAILGTGLLGGSLGIALRRRGLANSVIGHGRNEERLAHAKSLGAVDATTTDLGDAVRDADLVVCCTPVMHIMETLPAIAAAVKPGAIVTDVGSTKEAIVTASKPHADKMIFIGSHPMAGSDRSGVEFAVEDLYEGATTFVTVDAETPKDRAAQLGALWRAVGSRVVIAHPSRHDELVANISHLPHLLAVAAVRAVAEIHDDNNFLRWVIGNGFRDTTRVAKGSVGMWSDICATNPGAIINAIDGFNEQMRALRDQLVAGNERGIMEMLEKARKFRENLDDDSVAD